MQRTYESARALVNCAAGPLARHIDPFITSLIEQQYRPSVIYIKARHGLAFDRWLTKRQIVLADLCEAQIVQYQNRTRRRHQRIRAETRRIEWKALTQLLQFLRVRGICPEADVATNEAEDPAAQFGQHLQDQQGLAAATIERYRGVAQQFLGHCFGRGAVDLRLLRAGDAIAFIKSEGRRLRPPALKCVVNALRSFLRYAQFRGEAPAVLAAAVPTVSAWSTTPALPKAVSPEHAHRASDSCDLDTGVGLRDKLLVFFNSV